MASTRQVIVALLVLLAPAVAWAPPPHDDSPEAWDTLLDLEVAGRLLELCCDDQPTLDPPSRWMPLADFVKALPKAYSRRIRTRDAWNASITVGSVERNIYLFSNGRDGIAETIRALDDDSDESRADDSRFGDDVVFLVGEGMVRGPQTLASRQRQTMADLRSIGTAIETFSIDNNDYPLQDRGLQSIDSIGDRLAPTYIRLLPVNDAWGHPFLYWSDKAGYVVISAGADGVLDIEWDTFPPWDLKFEGETKRPEADIIFANGQFAQWPPIRL